MVRKLVSYGATFVAGMLTLFGFLVWDAAHNRGEYLTYFDISRMNYAEAIDKLKAQGYQLVYIAYEIESSDPDCSGEEGCYWYKALAPDGRYAEGVVRAGKKT